MKTNTTYTAKFVEAMKSHPEFKGLKTAKEIFARVKELRKEGRHPLNDRQYALWVLATRGRRECEDYIETFKFRVGYTMDCAKIKVAHLRKLIKVFNETLKEVR